MTTTLYEHPDFKSEKEDLKRYKDLYEGDHETLVNTDEYLWYLPIERKKPSDPNQYSKIVQIRYDRAQRTRYLNFPEMIVSLWVSLIFRKPYQLDNDAAKTLEGIEDDIDGQKTSFWEFLKTKVAPSLFVYGKVFALVDSSQEAAKSKSDEKQKGLRPFVELLEPLDCPDWQTETKGPNSGDYLWFRHEYILTEPRNSASEQPKQVRCSDVLTIRDGTYKVEKYQTKDKEENVSKKVENKGNWELKDTIPTQLTHIPLAKCVDETWIHEVCEETLRHFNLRSVKDTIEFTQGFTRTFVKGIDPTNDAQLDAFSNYTVTILPADGDVIAVNPTSTTDLKASVEEAVDNVFKVGLNKLRSLPSSSKENESGDSQAQDKENIYALAESTVTQIEGIANQILQHIAAFQGNDSNPGKITMSREFDEKSLTQWLSVYAAVRDQLKQYPELDKSAFKRALAELNLDDEVMERVDDILDKPISEDSSSGRNSILGRFLNGQSDRGGEEENKTEGA